MAPGKPGFPGGPTGPGGPTLPASPFLPRLPLGPGGHTQEPGAGAAVEVRVCRLVRMALELRDSKRTRDSSCWHFSSSLFTRPVSSSNLYTETVDISSDNEHSTDTRMNDVEHGDDLDDEECDEDNLEEEEEDDDDESNGFIETKEKAGPDRANDLQKATPF